MKKLILLLVASTMTISCADYDAQFDELNTKIDALTSANTQLQQQITELTDANLAAQLTQINSVIDALTADIEAVGTSTAAISAALEALAADVAALAVSIESLETSDAAIQQEIADIQTDIDNLFAALDDIHEDAHHSGGGAHHSGGWYGAAPSDSEFSTDISEPFAGSGATLVDGVYTFPATAQAWAGFANTNAAIYPLEFPNGGKVTFTASTSGTDVKVNFVFEYQAYPNVNPRFVTDNVTVSGSTATEYTVEFASQGGNTFSSFLLYIVERDSPVSISDVVITSYGS